MYIVNIYYYKSKYMAILLLKLKDIELDDINHEISNPN